MSAEDPTSAEQHQRSRTIGAPAASIFALLADPSRHHETEAGDWVRDAIDPAPNTGVGQVFAVNMFLERRTSCTTGSRSSSPAGPSPGHRGSPTATAS